MGMQYKYRVFVQADGYANSRNSLVIENFSFEGEARTKDDARTVIKQLMKAYKDSNPKWGQVEMVRNIGKVTYSGNTYVGRCDTFPIYIHRMHP